MAAKKQVREGASAFPVQTYERAGVDVLLDDAQKELGFAPASYAEEDVVLILTSKAVDYH